MSLQQSKMEPDPTFANANELKFLKLRKQKATAKASLTKSKNKLLKLIGGELPSRQAVRDLIDQVSVLQSKAINVICELSIAYSESGEVDLFKQTKQELKTVECESDAAIEKANLFLKHTLETTSVGSVLSGISKLYHSEKSVHSQTLQVKPTTPPKQENGIDVGFNTNTQNEQQTSSDGHNSIHTHEHTAYPMHPDRHVRIMRPDIGDDLWRQLKRVSIPMFSGKIAECEGWKAAFMACVDRAPASNEYKLLQLKQYLAGEAAQLIAKLGHSAAVYDIALERLERKYGGTRRQIALKLEEISNFKPLNHGNAKDLDKFADLLDIAVVSFREADKVEELGDGCLYALLLTKLPESMITSYKRWIYEQQRQESVETLQEWTLLESDFQTMAAEAKQGFSGKTVGKSKPGTFFGNQNQDKTLKCLVCEANNHKVWQCKQFKELDLASRWEKARELHLCFRCLGTNHRGKFCSRSVVCGIDGCKADHNRLLHGKQRTSWGTSAEADFSKSNMPQVVGSEAGTQTTMSTFKDRSSHLALRTIPVVVKNGNRSLTVNALLDDASNQTYINEDVASELQLVGESSTVTVNVLNNKTESFRSMSVEFDLESLDGSFTTKVNALTTRKVTGNMTVIDWRKHAHRWTHLRNIQFPKRCSRTVVDILIGVDSLDLHCSQGDVCGGPGEPIARLTPLGWTCVGNVATNEHRTHHAETFFVRNDNTIADNLDAIVQQFWEMEEIPNSKTSMSHNEKIAFDAVQNSLEYQNGRYKVAIPWKDKVDCLGDNYDMAFNRLVNLEKKLSKDKVVSDAYAGVITQYLQKGYIRKVSLEENKNSKWIMPHFPVVKLDRTTTKVRVVFDASAKYKGISLNDCINQGPKLQNELFEILLRFRQFPVGVICDIAEMYLQIEINEKDRPYFRFLWRDMDQDKTPEVYEFSRVVFGMNCSPFLAQYVSQNHAELQRTAFPLAAQTVLKSTYMDDNVDSVQTKEKAIELYEQLNAMWSSAGMHARKWISNSADVLDNIPVEDRLKEIEIHMSELPSVKALGLTWNAEKDVFQFSYQIQNKQLAITKRTFLKEMAKIFDPLGLLTPFSIRAKIILQEMWISGVDWDDSVAPHLTEKALQWCNEIEGLASLQITRCMNFNPDITQLHVFVDASQSAFGSVIYAVTEMHDGTTSSHLVASKTHVAPIKAVSIPRMELMAAVLGVKLVIAVCQAVQMAQHRAILWTDSSNELCWIRNQSRCFKPFIANRIGFIQEHTNPCQWKYVPTSENAADILTRGTHVQSLGSKEWLQGPDFLVSDNWPEQSAELDIPENLEKKKSCNPITSLLANLSCEEKWIVEPSRFSNWKRLCRIYAYFFRFLHNIRSPALNRKQGVIDCEDIEDAAMKIIAHTQKVSFPAEYAALLKNNKLPVSSQILALNPFMDEHGVIRSAGRLRYAEVLSYDARCPIILPKGDHVTKLIKSYHEKSLHGGTNTTLAAVSTRFWILSAREEIRRWERECAWCRRRKTKPTHQIMADLPPMRVQASCRPFEQVGVDYAGPFITVQGRGKCRQKRYLCLFTCLATKAVHLEIAFGLDSDSFLRALFRMADRRGMPKVIISDNGKNFVGAIKELKGLISCLKSDDVQSHLVNKGITWQFNPPHASHFGGVFESMIKSAKRAIFAILSSSSITDEELMSAFTGAEAFINSRPLTYQSAHPADIVPLTPNHFIHGQMGGEFSPELDDLDVHPRKRWRRVQELLRHTWQRWMKEWLPSLNVRKKWFTPTRDVRVDDVVMVISPENPRGSWPLGRIVRTHTGKDGHVRVVDIQVGKSNITRPVTKICPLLWE